MSDVRVEQEILYVRVGGWSSLTDTVEASSRTQRGRVASAGTWSLPRPRAFVI